jgi:hypothetical protein
MNKALRRDLNSPSLDGQELNFYVPVGRFQIVIGGHKNVVGRVSRQFYSEAIYIGNLSLEFDERSADGAFSARGYDI